MNYPTWKDYLQAISDKLSSPFTVSATYCPPRHSINKDQFTTQRTDSWLVEPEMPRLDTGDPD